jgi:hypothetical protein
MKKVLQLLLAYVPRRLPVGMTEFHEWSDRIIDTCGEFADRNSMKFALATQIMHLGPQKSIIADIYFVRSMQKAAANQIASAVFQEIKLKQQEEAKKAAEQAALDAANANVEKSEV